MVREKRDTNPVLFKIGLAVAISIGGIFYSFFRPKNNMKKPSISASTSASGFGDEGIKAKVTDEALDNSGNQEDFCYTQNEDKDQDLVPEFEEIMNDFNLSSPRAYIRPEKDLEPLYTYKSELEHMKKEEYEREISDLYNRVEFLQKRVNTLESELLKYYGLKEQESTITELQNRVKIHNTEAKLFNLKIEALQVENRKMKTKLVDYSKTVSELEAAREAIDLLKKKLKAEAESNKKQLMNLQERVKKMQGQELEAVLGDSKLQRIKELEEEAQELRNCNSNLRNENLELAQKLEQTHIQEDQKVEALKEETQKLKQQNEELATQVEQLQSSWCADIEELVYLRWLNACLRYEVRNYHPEPGKTTSRDLSKTLSPKSEEKAKQLIMEYSNKQGLEEKSRLLMDLDFDQWSSSQYSNSNYSDSGEFDDDSSLDHSNKTDTSSKKRIFGKLRKLLRGEYENSHKNHEIGDEEGNRMRRLSVSSERYSKGVKTEELKELESRRRNSEIVFPHDYKSLDFARGGDDAEQIQFEEMSGMAKERFKLAIYAEVLRNSSRDKIHRRAVSHS